jgi:hypothetical protein
MAHDWWFVERHISRCHVLPFHLRVIAKKRFVVMDLNETRPSQSKEWRSGRLGPVSFSISVRRDTADAAILSENSAMLR